MGAPIPILLSEEFQNSMDVVTRTNFGVWENNTASQNSMGFLSEWYGDSHLQHIVQVCLFINKNKDIFGEHMQLCLI